METTGDADFLRAFEARTIPFEAWTHRSHVRMAYLYLREHGPDEGLRRIRAGIQALNSSHGSKVPEGALDRGYHETMTVAWARVLEESRLVRSAKKGRVRTYRLAPAPLKSAEGWLARQRAHWERRLDGLDGYLAVMEEEKP